LYDSIVTGLGLAAADLHAALKNSLYEEKIAADFNGGVRSGVNGTPSFFINGQRYNGPPDFQTLAAELAEALTTAR
jgi:protein-disulfide isomerase